MSQLQSLRDLLTRQKSSEAFGPETTDELETEFTIDEPAPLPPVPPTFPSMRVTPALTSERFFMVTNSTSAGTASLDKQMQFGINSVKVDNLSTQWVYLPDIDQFVPPQNWGAILRANGSQRFRAIFETPPGITAATVSSSNERVMFFVTQEIMPISAGIGGKTS